MKIAKNLIEDFKGIRIRGTDVLAVPVNEADMDSPDENKKGMGFAPSSGEQVREEPIRFLAVGVGPGCYQHGILVPLDIRVGDIFVSSVTNKSLRLDWKEYQRTLCGHRILLFVAQDERGVSGSIPAIVDIAEFENGSSNT